MRIFPAAALVSWTVLSYLCVDFGFFHKLFNLRPEDNAVYRAAGEAAMASSFVIFLSTFLRLGLWHGMVRMMIGVWMVAQLTLVAVAVIDPRLAATFARLSFLMIGGVAGAQYGAKAGQKLRGEQLRALLALLVLAVALRLAFDLFVQPPVLYSLTGLDS